MYSESGNKLYLVGQRIVYKFIEKSINPKDAYESIRQADFNAKTKILKTNKERKQ